MKAGLAAGTGATLLGWGGLKRARAAETDARLCVAVCNHWSYIGIGWQLGIESNVLSVTDAMEIFDRPPHAKTCINLDARAYELIASHLGSESFGHHSSFGVRASVVS
ncbi:MAG: hypothetical protein JXB10_20330 [Pirellulales bacterium]|nr:hypothetical protein [Pirellulales bacterium]